jgi:hypothetical protein
VINDGRRIAKELKVSEATITMDMKYLRSQAKQQISKHIEEQMPLEYQKCLVGLDDTIGRMSDIMEEEGADKKNVISAAAVRMQAIRFKAEVLDSGIAIDEVTEFVEQYKNKQKQEVNTSQNGKVTIDDIPKDAQNSGTD